MLTPFPKETPVTEPKTFLVNFRWSQWLTALRTALNMTPGNSTPVLFADLPMPVAGMVFVVTDSTVQTWGAPIAGGGGFTVGAFYNGTNWTVCAI